MALWFGCAASDSSEDSGDAPVTGVADASWDIELQQFKVVDTAVDSEGSVYLVGHNGKYDFGVPIDNTTADYKIRKLNSDGTTAWDKTIDASGDNRATAIAIDSSDDIYVGGYIFGKISTTNPSRDLVIYKLDKEGNRLDFYIDVDKDGTPDAFPMISYNHNTNLHEVVVSMAFGPDGNLYTAFRSYERGGNGGADLSMGDVDWGIMKTTSDGVPLSFNPSNNTPSSLQDMVLMIGSDEIGSTQDLAFDIIVDSQNNVYVSGVFTKDRALKGCVRQFSATGLLKWEKFSDGTNRANFRTLAVDSSNNIYVAGRWEDSVDSVIIKKFDMTGIEDTANWNKLLEIGPDAAAYGMVVDHRGDIIMVGHGFHMLRADSEEDWIIKKFSPSGVEITQNWNKAFDFTNTGAIDMAKTIVESPLGGVIVTGYGNSSEENTLIKRFSN